jgi:hypothetical protein
MCALHTDDSMLAGPDKAETDQTIKEMQEAKFNITIEARRPAGFPWSKHREES